MALVTVNPKRALPMGFVAGFLRLRLKHKRGRWTARAASEPQKFRTLLESDHRHGRGLAIWGKNLPTRGRRDDRWRGALGRGLPAFPARALGRKALAALRAASRNDLGPAGRQHPLAKAMAALANELAGLIGTFHGQSLRCRPVISGRSDAPASGRQCRSCRIERRLYEASGVQVNWAPKPAIFGCREREMAGSTARSTGREQGKRAVGTMQNLDVHIE